MVINVYTTSSTSDKSSRHELLAFINTNLQANFTRIEELSTGAAYCQLTDLLFRGSIPLKKVKWVTRNDIDCLDNWRLLQISWKNLGINKSIPVERLICARFQDNFIFLQWFKKFFDANYNCTPYDVLAARNWQMLPPSSSNWTKTTSKNVRLPNASEKSVAASGKTKQQSQSASKTTPNVDEVKTENSAEKTSKEIDDITDFKIRMLEDRCKRLESNLNDMKKQRDSYAAIVHAINEYCENSDATFSRETILSIVRVGLLQKQLLILATVHC